jgi:hypothetical protein
MTPCFERMFAVYNAVKSCSTHASNWLTDHVTPPETPTDRVCELWSLSERPIPFLEKIYSPIRSIMRL